MSYDAGFFVDETREAVIAARVIMPWVLHRTDATSVIDVGCGTGGWLSAASDLGCRVHGVDWHTPDNALLIDPKEFERVDLHNGVSCEGYDLAVCLEVGEHLPASSSESLVAGLCKAKFVFWSAAVPNQRGVDHVNEQWPSWWEPIFAAHGYSGSCDIRDVFWGDQRIAPFYRQNIMLYSTPVNLLHIGMTLGVRDDIHPDIPHLLTHG